VTDIAESNTDHLIGRLVASVAAIPDPLDRAAECVRLGDEVRGLHARLASIRRRAIYEATLRPGATGRSVASELRVSAKTVSQATSDHRRRDLALLEQLVDAADQVLSSTDPDLTHARALIADSRSVAVIAQAVSRLSTPWIVAEHKALSEDEWWDIKEGFERAEYLAALGGLEDRSQRRRDVEACDDPTTPERLRWICRVFNALPGIRAYGTTHTVDNQVLWSVFWNITSADTNLSTFDTGPSPEGWLLSEWICWLARDYRRSGRAIDVQATAPPPYLNHPGDMLTFILEAPISGTNAVSPDDFADSIIRYWDGATPDQRTGYFPIVWPPKGST
jgi:hypothetical protein